MFAFPSSEGTRRGIQDSRFAHSHLVNIRAAPPSCLQDSRFSFHSLRLIRNLPLTCSPREAARKRSPSRVSHMTCAASLADRLSSVRRSNRRRTPSSLSRITRKHIFVSTFVVNPDELDLPKRTISSTDEHLYLPRSCLNSCLAPAWSNVRIALTLPIPVYNDARQ